MSEALLEKKLRRAKLEIAELEKLIEDKTRSLFLAKERLEQTSRFLENVMATIRSAVFVIDEEGRLASVNKATHALTATADLEGGSADRIVPAALLARVVASADPIDEETELLVADGTAVPVMFSSTPLIAEGERQGAVCFAFDVREKKQLELELRHAQKLESVGQLAAGVAHEINTPIQFAGDSVQFLQEAFEDLGQVLQSYEGLRREAASASQFDSALSLVAEKEDEVDLDFLKEEVPSAAQRAIDGVERVATIVKAMKAFAHPGDSEKAPQDLNQAIRTTLEVSRSEYKYVAEVELDLQPLPPVTCNLGDVNQVILNLIVNAAHAMHDRYQGTEQLGTLRISTRAEGGDAIIEVADTGGGIPKDVQPRIFDPFFTTKEVGRGTGQGLSISRNVIVDKHGGSLSFETQAGEGTTFRISLPAVAKG